MARESLEHVVKEPIHQVVESLVLPNCNSKLESCRESMLLSITSIQNHFEPVYLNVYDLLAEHQRLSFVMNCCACRRLGAYHTGVEIYGVEYYFGDGICKSRPRNHSARLINSIIVGETMLTKAEIEKILLIDMRNNFTRKHYDLLKRNCNHFTNDFLRRLLGINLPPWVNRFERCVITTPGCTKFLSKLFGKDWTKPTL